MAKYTLSKKDRLKSEKVISALFEKGSHIKSYPLKLIYLQTEITSTPSPLLFSVSVPKRLIKKAYERNLIKRRIREAYRLNCHEVKSGLADQNRQYSIMCLYMKNEVETSAKITAVMKEILDKFSKKINLS